MTLHVLEVVRVHGGVDDDLLELLDVLLARRLDGADVEPRRQEQVPAAGPTARDHVVALLGPALRSHVVHPEVAFEARLEQPLAVRDVLGGDGGPRPRRRPGRTPAGGTILTPAANIWSVMSMTWAVCLETFVVRPTSVFSPTTTGWSASIPSSVPTSMTTLSVNWSPTGRTTLASGPYS